MKTFIALIVLLPSLSLAQNTFKKIETPDLLGESKLSNLVYENGLQPIRNRSLTMMQVMLGTPATIRSVGPSAQVQWSRRMTYTSPVFLSMGLGYTQETKQNQLNQPRNFHHLPVFGTVGYRVRPLKSWIIGAEAGPALRMIMERGYTLEQEQNYSYGDLFAQVGLDYEWINEMTGSGRSLGLRVSRYFGLPDAAVAQPLDSYLAAFSWDL